MKAGFQVRDKQYQAEISAGEKSDDEKFQLYSVSVDGQEGGAVQGTLKITPRAIEVADARASKEGGSAEEWLARGCARSLAAEVLIRRLKPEFSFIVDHRWVQS